METRRGFLITLCAIGLPLVAPAHALATQVPIPPAAPHPIRKDEESNAPKLDPKIVLGANEKDIKKNVERLYQLAGELKAEVEKTDSVQVLSLTMLKKTEEIEKLAKEIRSRAKG
jgi:hypothetical protein